MQYIALLRGINVGGNNMIKMPELKAWFEKAGFKDVRTYIQSGNVLFATDETISTADLARSIEAILETEFKVPLSVVVISEDKYRQIIKSAPEWWGKTDDWRHNLIFLKEPYSMDDIVAAVGVLKPDIEMMIAGDGVLYQSASIAFISRTRTGRIVSLPVYKQMTIRNYNTTQKLLQLLDEYITPA